MFPQKKTTRLPEVRRMPGQSLRDEKDRLTENWLVPLYFSSAFAWVFWGWEEYRALTHTPPQPTALLCVALVITACSWVGLRRLIPKFRNLNRGERGELRVGDVLHDLRSYGYRAVHDLVRDGFNVDHVLVGPAGVFAIETKFRSGKGEITFRNGEGLFVGGFPEEKNSLSQARASAAEVNRLIKETCRIDVWVKPVVVFVGDWRVKNDWRTTDARVFTTDRLADHIVNQQPRLTRREIDLIASNLERSAEEAISRYSPRHGQSVQRRTRPFSPLANRIIGGRRGRRRRQVRRRKWRGRSWDGRLILRSQLSRSAGQNAKEANGDEDEASPSSRRR